MSASTILASLGLLLLPLAIWAEDSAPRVWNNRLWAPLYTEEANRHTPRVSYGTYLPPTITSSQTYTSADNPLILTTTTTIPANITVTLTAGVTVLTHEFATMNIAGTLTTTGTVIAPVRFTTNETHPENQQWNGLVVTPGGHTNLSHTVIEHASPALSCLPQSTLTADHLKTRFGLVGLYNESNTCHLNFSHLQALHYGIVNHGGEVSTTDTTISAGKKDILHFDF